MENKNADEESDLLYSTQHLAYVRTKLASERTFYALLRTGFTIAGAGTLIATLLSNNWPYWLSGIFASVFVVSGFSIIIAGLRRHHRINFSLDVDDEFNPIPTRLFVVLAVVLQVTLVVAIFLYFFHA